MTFSRILAWAAAAVAAALAGCGGGTSQYETFVPGRLLVFGDETSLLTTEGRKYSINGYSTSTDGTNAEVADCSALPNWVQSVASHYGFVFAECNPSNVENPQALMLARAGARVADIKIQVDQLVGAGGFRVDDMATMLAGRNDILELYAQFPGRSEADLLAEARERGRQLALQVNRLVDFGTKVLVSTMPDVGVTPYALKQRLEFGDTDRAALLSRLSAGFNEQLGANIIIDGRFVGLVQGDLRVQSMVRVPAAYGLINVTDRACQEGAEPPACDSKTLVEDATAGSYLWSDDLHLTYAAQQQLAALALDRATRNPF